MSHAHCSWHIHIVGTEESLYAGEEYLLQYKFNPKYPFAAPQVYTCTCMFEIHVYTCTPSVRSLVS